MGRRRHPRSGGRGAFAGADVAEADDNLRGRFAAHDGDGHFNRKFARAGTDAAGFNARDAGFVAGQMAGEELAIPLAMRFGDDHVVDDLPAQFVERAAERGLRGGVGIDDSALKVSDNDAIDGALLECIEFLAAQAEEAIAVLQFAGGLVVGIGQMLLLGLGGFVGLVDGVDEIAQMSGDGVCRSKEPVELAQEHAVHRTLSAAAALFRTRGISPLPSSFIGVKDGLL